MEYQSLYGADRHKQAGYANNFHSRNAQRKRLKKRFYHHAIMNNQGDGMMRVRIQEVSDVYFKRMSVLKRGGQIKITPPIKSNIL